MKPNIITGVIVILEITLLMAYVFGKVSVLSFILITAALALNLVAQKLSDKEKSSN